PSEFRFLFVGSTLERKGLDLLIDTYIEEFKDNKDVKLVIHDNLVDAFDNYQNIRDKIESINQDESNPVIEFNDTELSEQELADLYKSCDCFVYPYKTEASGIYLL